MKCQSCETTIDPKWRNAIEKNECPFCGDVIMDAKLKDLLKQAKGLFEELMKEEYKSSFVDWVRANYSLVLTNQKLTTAETSVLVKTDSPGSVLDGMLKRAGAKSLPKEDRIANAMSQISGSGSLTIETDEPPLNQDEIENMSGVINSAMGYSSLNGDDESIPPHILQMASKAGASKDVYNPKDVIALQNLMNKSASARESVLGGGKAKGGFTRSS